ncbi:PKP3 protein, partial [Podilymbus podiceps]|nr:PKP3 protein [Podilymbus podiceps]
MQETNTFLLSALQPEAGVCSLALPSDRQLDGRNREAAEAQRLRSARVQEQVRIRMMLRGQAAACPEGPDHADGGRGGQYGTTLRSSFSSRSQGNGLDTKASLYQPLAKQDFSTLKGSGWSSRSAVDLTPHKRMATISNGGLAKGRGYGTGYAMSQAANTSPRPSSFHERNYRSRQNFDTLSLRSLRLADGPLQPTAAADDRYSVISEQLDPVAHRPLYKSQGNGGFTRSYTFERQMSAGSTAKAASDWLEGSEVTQSRTIRAPAMRTLQRFQSNNRSRLSTGSFGSMQAGVGGSYLGMVEHGSRAPSVRSLAESSHRLQDQRAVEMYNGHGTLLSHQSGGFDDIDLPSAVKYLIASDPNLQVLGAAYLQHKCYSDSNAKKQARSLQAMPKLVKLFNSPNQEVQRHATGAMRNLIYDNAENKLALVEENGIYELMRTLREPDDELRKNVTGILWNLSSSDHLKDRLARDTLEQLTDLVLVPLSGLGGSGVIQQNPSEAEIFYNSTGFLRNLSSASQQTRQKMRECHGLVDSMIHYVNSSLEVGKSEDKSVENAVCVLRNLSYRLYDEMPPSSLQRLEGHRRNNSNAVTGELVGCFSPQSKKAREHYLNADIVTFTEVSKDPKGMEWLWNPQIVGIYNRLLQRCELNKHTTEAASGALQNITAGDRRWAGVLSRLALEQERILNPVLDRVRTADHHQLRSLTGLIRNLSRHARNKDEMSTKVVSHLIEKLPGSVGDKALPADVIVNIIAVLNNLVVESPMAARDIVYFDGLRKLFYIKKRRDSSDSEKSSRAAASLLGNMWQYTKLHRDFKMKGYRKEDFLGL